MPNRGNKMVKLKNFSYEIFITDSTGSCAGTHLELNVWGADDEALIEIAQNIKQSLRNTDNTMSVFADLKKGIKNE